MDFDDLVIEFLEASSTNGVEMVMVGGGAVNFHGYQRHSADVDFWINVTPQNLTKLKTSLQNMGFELKDFPDKVKQKQQNISLKISPYLEIELITNFDLGRSFDEVFEDAEIATIQNVEKKIEYRVLNLQDLISSKTKSARPKDLLDIQELKRIQEKG